MKQVFKKPYIYWTILVFTSYIILNIITSGFYAKIPLFIFYAKTVNWISTTISISLTIFIAFLVSINAVYAYIKYKERQKCKEAIVSTSIGAIGGLIAGVCPLCITGLFPLIFSLFGFSFSFASLPFQGIEVQALIVIILLLSLYMLNRRNR